MQSPKITQSMIDLYDEYTHVTLDRRRFLDRLKMLTGSAAAAAAVLPLIEANPAHAGMTEPADARLLTETVAFPGPKGAVSGYLARPATMTGKLPAVIVIHENRGLNPHIQDVTRRAALEGFLALGVDFLSSQGGTPADEDQGREMIGKLPGDEARATAVAAADYLRSHPMSNGKVGAIGFCWGGGLVNQLAVTDPKLGAGVAYYGRQADAGDVPAIQAPLMLHYAELDERINAGIAAYEDALKAAGKTYEIHVYPGVNHAFNNDTSSARYDAKAAGEAWERSMAFLKANLS